MKMSSSVGGAHAPRRSAEARHSARGGASADPAPAGRGGARRPVWLRRLTGAFTLDIGIDLGTANTLVHVRDQGIVLSEPSVVAVTRGSLDVLHDGRAVGTEAKKMIGKVSHAVDVIRPLQDGVVSNVQMTEAMLRYFIDKVRAGRRFSQTRVVIAIPYGVTHAEMKAAYNAAVRAGADKVKLIEETLAAASGAGIRVDEPTAHLVLDIGGGTTGIAVVSVGDIAFGATLRVAGDRMNLDIADHVLQQYGLKIGPQTAEALKLRLGSAMPLEEELVCRVNGQTDGGRPGTVEVSSADVREAIAPTLQRILRGVDWVLENTPPELSADLVEHGAVVTGGGALLPRIDQFIGQHVGLPVRIAEEPLNCVVRGAARQLEEMRW